MRQAAFIMLILALACTAVVPAAAEGVEDEKEAVKKAVVDAYVKGAHSEWDPEAMRTGFHPDFVLLGLRDGKLTKLPIADWIADVEKRKKERPEGPAYKASHEFSIVDVVGDAAIVRIELHRDGKHIFSDYLSLYKFPDGWKIVGKIYQRHQ